MCGLAGIIAAGGGISEGDRKLCRAMTRAIAHRGPDAEGFYDAPGLAFGHRRLSIIDLASGQQPMISADGRYAVVFNGEIYNYLELRRELEGKGAQFRTKSDTEVLLHGYAAWGDVLPEKLRGMFAFAVQDTQTRRTLAARDPIGKKPFYFRREGDRLIFASEFQALLCDEALSRDIDNEALSLYLALGYVPAPLTLYRGIAKLEAGEALTLASEGFRRWKYWRPLERRKAAPSPEAWVETLEQHLLGAVSRRLMSEVPLGAMLSGGIDSNLVVAEMARTSTSRVRTFTAGFDSRSALRGIQDERAVAASAAAHYGTDHSAIDLPSTAFDELKQLAGNLGEPLADPSILPTYLICREAKRHVTVALTGDGGDEPFGGYSFRYLPHLREQRLRENAPAGLLRAVAGPLSRLWPSGESVPRSLRLQTVWRNLAVSPLQAFLLDQMPRWPENMSNPRLQSGMRLALGRMDILASEAAAGGLDDMNQKLWIDTRLYMCENVLVKADRMSMAAGLELRAPLLDQDLIEFAFSLPIEAKIREGECKWLLRKLAANRVWPELFKQPKTGFSIPIDTYLRGAWREGAEAVLLKPEPLEALGFTLSAVQNLWREFQAGVTRHTMPLWTLLQFSLWWHGVHRRPAKDFSA